ncbi:MAG TPA: GtrA family protein [Coxiellaceae bacterium]|nr:MAG: hypothetical protein A3E81_05630 [Gammaproteobacteria bacterium RIFCSPHIGHO2_12_FULL_36_30]HLB56975.1 GtrA family protein [Coxiellaceae bacterium]
MISIIDKKFYLFCFVGFLSLVVNLLFFKLFVALDFHPVLASVLASFIAVVNGFLWNDNLTWKGHKHPVRLKRLLQFPQYVLISCVAIAINAGMVKYFMFANWNIFLGQICGIAVGTFWNFFANRKWTWKKFH